MPKSRTRKRPKKPSAGKIPWGGAARGASARTNIILGAIGAAVAIAGALYWWQSAQSERAFLALAAQGQGGLLRVQSFPNEGRDHLDPGQTYHYDTAFPTSGPHARTWTEPGFYDDPQPATMLVHALEHGHVIVYYDDPGPEALATLKEWTGLYGGAWDGVIAAPSPGLGRTLVLTAWRKMLKLEAFDAAAGAAFIDAFRGRGPERPVR
ncbi:MAG: DUF3105 domain-containing protein [Kiloniellaceae bacterium]